MRYCTKGKITFTRGRPYWKNDQAHVEQKNWSIVRRELGYGRYDTPEALAQLNRVYDELRVWTNFWQPTLKLVAKTRNEATGKTHNTYDEAQTPYQHVLAADAARQAANEPDLLPAAVRTTLAEPCTACGPRERKRRLDRAKEHLFRLQQRSRPLTAVS